MDVIEPGFAQALATLVSAGLVPGDQSEERARAALMGVALALVNACPNDEQVASILSVGSRATVTLDESGAMVVDLKLPEPEPVE